MTRAVIALSVVLAAIAYAQPGIGQNGVANAASQIAPTLPGGAIARGALFDISGVRLVSAEATKVTITGSGRTLLLTLVSAQPRHVEALMPRDAPLGQASLVVTVGTSASRPFPVEIVASNPGIFSRNLEGWGPGRIDNLASNGARSSNSIVNPARPGERIRIATTGLGDAREASIDIGGRQIRAIPARGERDGEEQLTFAIPADAPKGCWVPLYLLAAPNRASNVVTVSIAPAGAACDPGPVPVWAKKNVMVVALSRSRQKPSDPSAPEILSDDMRVIVKANNSESALDRNDLLPPAGTCTAATSSYQAPSDLTLTLSSLAVPRGRGLDAGDRITLRRGAEKRDVIATDKDPGNYRARLGISGVDTHHRIPPPFLVPGDFDLEVAGGKDIGPFSTRLSIPTPFQWPERDQIHTVNRKLPLTIQWTGGERDQLMLIGVRNVDLITTAIATCVCVVPAQAHRLTIPAALLANIPASIRAPGAHYDILAIGTLNAQPLQVNAKGFDSGFSFVMYDNSRYVEFR